jgi:hypothetical protein
MAEKQGFIERLALRYIKESVQKNILPTDEPYILNQSELKVIRKTRAETLLAAAILGTLGVLFLYLPQYLFPTFFPATKIILFGRTFNVEIITTVYGLLLIWPEIWGLNYFNLRAVRIISNACVFPRRDSKELEKQVDILTQTGLEIEHKGLDIYKIDPYLGVPKLEYLFFILLARFKATLSNIFVKVILKRILGRFALRQITDLAGIPVFAFWNAWASYQVIKEAKIRIMAPMAIAEFLQKLKATEPNLQIVKNRIPELMQYAAQLKRKYNFAIYLLAEALHQEFDLKPVAHSAEIKQIEWTDETRNVISKILACAFIVDGVLNKREIAAIRKLEIEGHFIFSVAEMQQKALTYASGKGLHV